ncbi:MULTISPECIES: ABC transporter ATP-binding protein [unclassified Arthrobacter]|uniref:ABC transporter ATP-binding protein n=1 Tax=unclassified Arthrobacter TaxID=235627 RepID=UPI002106EEEB|nr:MULTISPECIES: ABC transporter ATP-binding protein [unclassified Arthrobacter]MCQ1947231.1 ABC transporter ATP-binding protein [Arthrobacter sp. zg-Y1116]MCQ1995282.1 ABC transporter ATP-binding protein [Arthrobacter sp. zg-Y1171]UWX80679.1 ABC transporter ATP-binding protein [Arthrobacter sp. zg-Y1171]
MEPGSGSAVVRTRGLHKNFGRVAALKGIDLDVPAGSVFGVIGPNGAGKTTLMRLLLDLLRPSSGEIAVLGVNPRSGGPALRRRIGFLPGDPALADRVSGRELLRFFSHISGAVDPGTVPALAERLDLDLGRPVRALSKGNRQKLGLIQAFMHQPPLLILDEPTSGLDPLVQQEFLALVREASSNGQTVLLSSHVLSEIEEAADTVAILRKGAVVSAASTADIRASAGRRVRIGIPAAEAPALVERLRRVPGFELLQVPTDPDPLGPASIHGRFKGDMPDLITALAGHHLLDLVVQEPDLEEAVLRFYGPENAAGPADGGAAE